MTKSSEKIFQMDQILYPGDTRFCIPGIQTVTSRRLKYLLKSQLGWSFFPIRNLKIWFTPQLGGFCLFLGCSIFPWKKCSPLLIFFLSSLIFNVFVISEPFLQAVWGLKTSIIMQTIWRGPQIVIEIFNGFTRFGSLFYSFLVT